MGCWPLPPAADLNDWPPGAREPITFEAFMDAALYDPEHGFYTASGGGAGRRGDFLTSVEVGPLFGALTARYLDAVWDALDRPDPFQVVDVGAGPGTWARTIRAAGPRCGPALALTLVERSPHGRANHPDGVRTLSSDDDVDGAHVVLANELLDNLPVRILERHAVAWQELWVGPAGEELRALPAELVPPAAERLAPDAARAGEVARIPVAERAARWVEGALGRLRPGGRLLVFDYGADTAELAGRSMDTWLRTYRAQERGGSPLSMPGTQDITCEVPFDQLPGGAARCRQAEWLARWGIDQLVEEGRRVWRERAGQADLRALRARSRIREAEALLDVQGLGGFWAAEWAL